ncbi:DNA (cytosine-5-)-methyltransferase [candidate division LCP-89 bacterium B3_LCP]|uniref:Cytosine-specific methyltransferase n=1 Tax=candidate division LCP-89 bacterium B3_LCP TaxID=2012998 RepID=A0A532UZS1_UNCL8|nr:MAG: DNA (cytosine-5-)-methyltransferase [candidate division LCP-89 bacterium B3_LCP]
MSFSVVDLFCGVGGLTHGLTLEGVKVNAGIDLDPACRYPYEKNNDARFIERDVGELSSDDIKSLFPRGDMKILVGCAPCQPFSTYNQGKDHKNDSKWGLLYTFGQLIEEIQPTIVSMENVPRLSNHNVYKDFVQLLERNEYKVKPFNVYCPKYGIPQTRKRLVLFASKLGELDILPSFCDPNQYSTVRQAIGHLEPLQAGEVSTKDSLHRARNLSTLNLNRIRASRPGGSWREWDKDLIADCHKKETCRTFTSVYGRMEWDKPSPTMTTLFHGFGNGRFGHPEQDRAISIREAALIQSFPEDYEFVEKDSAITFMKLGRLIGNAVPVNLGKVIAQSIIKHLETYS